MTDTLFPLITGWFRRNVNAEKAVCMCGHDLRCEVVLGYQHDGGWFTPRGRYWLFVKCPTCGYDTALWKMGVPRDQRFDYPMPDSHAYNHVDMTEPLTS